MWASGIFTPILSPIVFEEHFSTMRICAISKEVKIKVYENSSVTPRLSGWPTAANKTSMIPKFSEKLNINLFLLRCIMQQLCVLLSAAVYFPINISDTISLLKTFFSMHFPVVGIPHSYKRFISQVYIYYLDLPLPISAKLCRLQNDEYLFSGFVASPDN